MGNSNPIDEAMDKIVQAERSALEKLRAYRIVAETEIDRKRDGIAREVYAYVLKVAREDFQRRANELEVLAQKRLRLHYVALAVSLLALGIAVASAFSVRAYMP